MIKIEKIEAMGWDAAIRGMRNPLNSWHLSDSESYGQFKGFKLGERDLDLCKRLISSGSEHRKFLRMIHVQMDITAPLYWWKEADTYKVGVVTNSCSTMHKIHDKEFTIDDFSTDHILKPGSRAELALDDIIAALNVYRDYYLEDKDKNYWWQMIQLLPSSYNQKRTIDLNYENLLTIYKQRKNHKLDEWLGFCEIIKKLPHMNEFLEATGEEL